MRRWRLARFTTGAEEVPERLGVRSEVMKLPSMPTTLDEG